jgi:hypothetical protein
MDRVPTSQFNYLPRFKLRCSSDTQLVPGHATNLRICAGTSCTYICSNPRIRQGWELSSLGCNDIQPSLSIPSLFASQKEGRVRIRDELSTTWPHETSCGHLYMSGMQTHMVLAHGSAWAFPRAGSCTALLFLCPSL